MKAETVFFCVGLFGIACFIYSLCLNRASLRINEDAKEILNKAEANQAKTLKLLTEFKELRNAR